MSSAGHRMKSKLNDSTWNPRRFSKREDLTSGNLSLRGNLFQFDPRTGTVHAVRRTEYFGCHMGSSHGQTLFDLHSDI